MSESAPVVGICWAKMLASFGQGLRLISGESLFRSPRTRCLSSLLLQDDPLANNRGVTNIIEENVCTRRKMKNRVQYDIMRMFLSKTSV